MFSGTHVPLVIGMWLSYCLVAPESRVRWGAAPFRRGRPESIDVGSWSCPSQLQFLRASEGEKSAERGEVALLKSLEAFRGRNRLEKHARRLMARKTSDSLFPDLQAEFRRMDTAGTGVISFENFKAGMAATGFTDAECLADLFQQVDTDGSQACLRCFGQLPALPCAFAPLEEGTRHVSQETPKKIHPARIHLQMETRLAADGARQRRQQQRRRPTRSRGWAWARQPAFLAGAARPRGRAA